MSDTNDPFLDNKYKKMMHHLYECVFVCAFMSPLVRCRKVSCRNTVILQILINLVCCICSVYMCISTTDICREAGVVAQLRLSMPFKQCSVIWCLELVLALRWMIMVQKRSETLAHIYIFYKWTYNVIFHIFIKLPHFKRSTAGS